MCFAVGSSSDLDGNSEIVITRFAADGMLTRSKGMKKDIDGI